MKNVIKSAVVLFTALSFSFANAGELSVTGSAKASYVIVSSDSSTGAQEQPNSLGVANEFSLKAGGEMDNGMTFGYNIDIDGDTTQDDGSLFLDTGSMGKIMISISEGGLETSKKGIHSATGDRGSDSGYDEGMFEEWSVGDANNVSYHLPADLLPFGIKGSIAYAPSTVADANQSVNNLVASNTGAITAANNSGKVYTSGSLANAGRSFTQYAVSAAPIDGLSSQGSVAETSSEGTAANGEEGISANVGAKYTIGQISVGYTEGGYQAATGATLADETVYYENKFYGIQFDVNDALSVSYNVDESAQNTRVAVAAAATVLALTRVE